MTTKQSPQPSAAVTSTSDELNLFGDDELESELLGLGNDASAMDLSDLPADDPLLLEMQQLIS